MWDVVKHPIEVLRDPDGSGPSKAYSDLAGLASGETRQVQGKGEPSDDDNALSGFRLRNRTLKVCQITIWPAPVRRAGGTATARAGVEERWGRVRR
jgi:hypothetical protein